MLIPPSAIADDPSALISLKNVAKRLKESLSRQLLFDPDTKKTMQRTVTLVMRDGEIYRNVVKLDQNRFSTLTKQLSNRFSNLIENGLTSISLRDGEIGQVVLVGGGAQLYSIYHMLAERFAGTNIVLADNPDESVGCGCCLEYGASSQKKRPTFLLPGFGPELAQTTAIRDSSYALASKDGDEFPLDHGDNLIGRSLTNQIQIAGDSVSRVHAKIAISKGKIEILDLGSTNGTFVNGMRLGRDQVMQLTLGDEVRLGDVILQIRFSR